MADLDKTGGVPIMYYEVAWDSGTSGAIWSAYTTLPANNDLALITGLSSG